MCSSSSFALSRVFNSCIEVMDILTLFSRPRWLYSIGKSEQARKILANLHSQNGDCNSPLINLEMEEIEEKIEVDGADSMLDY